MTVDVHRAAEPEPQAEAEVQQGPKAPEAPQVHKLVHLKINFAYI